MARSGKHIGALVFESGLIGGGFAAEKMLTQIPGWGWLTYAIVAGFVSIPLIYGPEIKQWRARRRSVALTPAAIVEPEAAPATTPMRGIPEMERCREELAEYIIAATKQRMVDGEHMAASIRFLPHLLELCEILDSQNIPHPKVKLGLVVLNGGEWGRYFANLWAVRHDIERARRVYKGEGSHP